MKNDKITDEYFQNEYQCSKDDWYYNQYVTAAEFLTIQQMDFANRFYNKIDYVMELGYKNADKRILNMIDNGEY
jgi:tRNA U34 2-thiouridine synthase MnmA/TrmU